MSQSAPFRDAEFGPREVSVARNDDGVMYVRPVQQLGSYPVRLTDKLDHWASAAPDRVFMGQRDETGEWRTLSYSQFRERARSVAQALLSRAGRVTVERPIAILSGNDLEHAILGFAAQYAGIPYAPISTAYSLISSDFGKLRHIFGLLTPGLVFVSDPVSLLHYKRALDTVLPEDAELVIHGSDACVAEAEAAGLRGTRFSRLLDTPATEAVDRATQNVGPDTIAKLLFTSGSTGTPKGVIQTQRMLTSNQELVRSVLRFVDQDPPVLCDWLPWNHTFGGNHDVGFVLYNGGSFYIDEGRPTPAHIEATIRNLNDVQPNIYLNVPKGFEALIPYLKDRPAFRGRFFERVKLLYYAGAGLLQPVWDEIEQIAVETCGHQIIMFTGLGSTETGPAALFPGKDLRRAGEVGLPAAGVELKLVPAGFSAAREKSACLPLASS